MLEKVLDKYYTKKLMKQIKEYLDVFNLDKRIVYYKDYAILEVKRRKWKEENYITVFSCRYEEAFINLLNLGSSLVESLIKMVEEKVKET